ncbi:hypothetical protein HZY91_06320 [Facklamia sp. DSM 111018]|uniref:YolD-like family protein n=1 Tax=Facklamia lactis TaxID=2749967 RepID=A0ABS0LTA9_9LACT|nr:hypothetical protein [Facklamia lactis]MBG9980695.1 hypothetical protein [Facklamia lactis]MBG9986509.1 hypothetical protein [Facklamia lactis]
MKEKFYRNRENLKVDRGMVKWQGFILSEHSEVLRELTEQYSECYEPPVQQVEYEIEQRLKMAYIQHLRIQVILNFLENGRYFYCTGYVLGYDGEDIWIGHQKIHRTAIRRIIYLEEVKFWQ